jgi:hypothetical protein
MNEPSSENMLTGATPAPAFKNRSTGLTVFGILTIVFGSITGLMVLISLLGLAMAASNPNLRQTSMSAFVLSVFLYGGLAAALIWLGIGSIMARRWARALILIFSWAWLVMGVFMVFFMGYFMPKAWENMPSVNGQPAIPQGTIFIMTVFGVLFAAIFFVILPLVWIFFYANHHTQATVEMRDPVRRWTDACPLPVLGLSLWLFISALTMLFFPVLYHGIAPFFGVFLSGLLGSLLYVAVAGVWAYCAWRLYNMDVRGWWIALIAVLLYMVSSLMTFARHDALEMYHLMGYPQAQIDQLQKLDVFSGNKMIRTMLVFFVPFLGYIVYVKQYLTGDKVVEAKR